MATGRFCYWNIHFSTKAQTAFSGVVHKVWLTPPQEVASEGKEFLLAGTVPVREQGASGLIIEKVQGASRPAAQGLGLLGSPVDILPLNAAALKLIPKEGNHSA